MSDIPRYTFTDDHLPIFTAEDAYSTQEMDDTCERMRNALSRAMVAKKDHILNDAVTEHLGHSSWQLFAIAHRIKRCNIVGTDVELWTLDGFPLVEFRPLRAKMEMGVDYPADNYRKAPGTYFVARTQYRPFPKPVPGTPTVEEYISSPVFREPHLGPQQSP